MRFSVQANALPELRAKNVRTNGLLFFSGDACILPYPTLRPVACDIRGVEAYIGWLSAPHEVLPYRTVQQHYYARYKIKANA